MHAVLYRTNIIPIAFTTSHIADEGLNFNNLKDISKKFNVP